MLPLVILDLDGTIIGGDGQVQQCVWQAIEKLQAAGVKLCVCTGRPGAGIAMKIAQRIGPRNPHIFHHGALVTYVNGDTVQVAAIRESTAATLVRQARDLGLILEIYTPSGLYVERNTPLTERHARLIGMTPLVRDLRSVIEDEPVVRAQWLVPIEDRALVESLPVEDAEMTFATSPGMPDTAFISATRLGTDKGSGVRQLTDSLRINPRDVMAIGDSEGDIPMLDAVGHPVVMGDAPLSVRERYGTVAGSITNCGVVPALEEALTIEANDSL